MAYSEDFAAAAVTQAAATEETPAAEAAIREDSTVQTEPADTAAEAEAPQADSTPARVPIRFNHQYRELTGEEAAAYAQKGLKWEAFREDYDRLRFLAEGAGQTVSQLIENWMAQDEERELREALESCKDPETAQQLTALRRQQRMTRFESSEQKETARAQTEQEDCNRRLAADYCALKEAVPEAPGFDQLPPAVIRTAVEQGISLFDAYLRHAYEQQRITEAAAAQSRRSAQASTGSLAGQVGEESREGRDFLTAFEQVFQ